MLHRLFSTVAQNIRMARQRLPTSPHKHAPRRYTFWPRSFTLSWKSTSQSIGHLAARGYWMLHRGSLTVILFMSHWCPLITHHTAQRGSYSSRRERKYGSDGCNLQPHYKLLLSSTQWPLIHLVIFNSAGEAPLICGFTIYEYWVLSALCWIQMTARLILLIKRGCWGQLFCVHAGVQCQYVTPGLFFSIFS